MVHGRLLSGRSCLTSLARFGTMPPDTRGLICAVPRTTSRAVPESGRLRQGAGGPPGTRPPPDGVDVDYPPMGEEAARGGPFNGSAELSPHGVCPPSSLDVLDAKLLRPPGQEFIEFRFCRPENLILERFNQTIDRGIFDYRLDHPVVFVLNIYEHREGILSFLQDRDEWHHVIRH